MPPALLVPGAIVEPRPSPLGYGGVALVLALAAVGVQQPSRSEGMPVHEDVPHTVARRTPTPIRSERPGPWDRRH